MRRFYLLVVCVILVIMAGCKVVPTTGDKITDAASAENFIIQSIPGYTVTDAASVTQALSQAGVAGSFLSGNLPAAAAIAKIDSVVQCYKSVGAVAARVYTESNIVNTISGNPKIGVLAVINTTRIGRNLLSCVLNTGPSAQAAGTIEPCGGQGSFKVNNEDLQYLYAATTPELCQTFQANFNGR
jgi:hypothetical protein